MFLSFFSSTFSRSFYSIKSSYTDSTYFITIRNYF
nr:MAG TPA: hypothetical protein [Caudoviricetes sp.]